MLVPMGHHVLLHGRNPAKLAETENALSALAGGGQVESYVCDLSRMPDVAAFANAVAERHADLDVLINNAGVYNAADPETPDGLDIPFRRQYDCALSPDAAALAAAWFVRSGDQPVLRRAVPGRSERHGQTGRPIRRCGIRAKQTGADHVVAQPGAFDEGARSGNHRRQSRIAARQQDGERGLWRGRKRHSHRRGNTVPCRTGRRIRGQRPASISTTILASSHRRIPDALDAKKSDEVVRVIEAIMAEKTQ